MTGIPRLSLKNAFPCPNCKSVNTKIPDSWLFDGYVMRKRRCHDCNTVFGTVEYATDPAHDVPRLAAVQDTTAHSPATQPLPVQSRSQLIEATAQAMFGKTFNDLYSDEQMQVTSSLPPV